MRIRKLAQLQGMGPTRDLGGKILCWFHKGTFNSRPSNGCRLWKAVRDNFAHCTGTWAYHVSSWILQLFKCWQAWIGKGWWRILSTVHDFKSYFNSFIWKTDSTRTLRRLLFIRNSQNNPPCFASKPQPAELSEGSWVSMIPNGFFFTDLFGWGCVILVGICYAWRGFFPPDWIENWA